MYENIIGTKNTKTQWPCFLYTFAGHKYYVKSSVLILCHDCSNNVVAACRKIAKYHRKSERENNVFNQIFWSIHGTNRLFTIWKKTVYW